MTVSSWNGGTTLYLPRSFCGPMTTTTGNGSTKTSPALSAQTTLLSESSRVRRAFVGDMHACGFARDPAGWTGDELVIDSKNGSVKLMYLGDDEPRPPPPGTEAKGFGLNFDWIWGSSARAGSGFFGR